MNEASLNLLSLGNNHQIRIQNIIKVQFYYILTYNFRSSLSPVGIDIPVSVRGRGFKYVELCLSSYLKIRITGNFRYCIKKKLIISSFYERTEI